ncbi:mucin-17-like isoform X2 [Patiria miniata]|nr:mucin-17-like isoform X2 [Patiria miniata]
MEINMKEAKQKGIFNRPRRVTLVRREDSGFHSTEVGAGSKAPTCNQLSTAMLKRNTSATALVDIKGELIPNTILVDKGSMLMSEEASGKLVALNSHDHPVAARSEEKHTGNLKEEASKNPVVNQKLSDDSSRGGPNGQDSDNNNTSKPSSDSDMRGCVQVSQSTQGAPTGSSRDDGDHLTATEYFLTEGGEASPIKGKSAQESGQDYPATPAVRTLQHLMQIADADRKGSDSESGDSPALTEQQVPKNPPTTHHSDEARPPPTTSARRSRRKSLPPRRYKSQETQPSRRPSLNKVVDLLVSKAVENKSTAKLNPKKLDSDLSSTDDLGSAVTPATVGTLVTLPSHVETEPQKIEGLIKRTKWPMTKTPSERCSIVLSPVDGDKSSPCLLTNDGKRTVPNLCKDPEGHVDHSYVSETNDAAPIRAVIPHGENTYSSSANLKEALLNAGVSVSDRPASQTLNQNPCETNGQVARDDSKSDRPSDEVSDGVPTLRIGSVYSLSEKEAKELFPDTKLAKPATKPVESKPETDRTNPVNPTANLGVTVQSQPIHTPQAQRINIGGQSQSSGNVAGGLQRASTFPFSNSSNVKLYNITSSVRKRAVCTPVTTVAMNPPANLAPSNFIGVPSSTGVAKLQQPVYPPATQMYTLIPSTQTPICPNPSKLLSFVPVQVGTLQGATVSSPRAVPVFPTSAVQVIPPTSTHFPVRISTSAAPSVSKSQTPAGLSLPVGTPSPGSILSKIVVTRISNEASGNVQTALGANASEVEGENKPIPVSSCVVPKTCAASGVAGSGHAVVSPPQTATAQASLIVSAKRTMVIRKVVNVPTLAGAKETPSTQQTKSGVEPKPSAQPGANPLAHAVRKTFLVTTSNGEKRLVSLPADADAAGVLMQMASSKAFQFVVPQKAVVKQTEIKKDNQEEKQSSEGIPSKHSSKEAKKSSEKRSHKSRHKTKKKLPILKIKFRKEPQVDPNEELHVEPKEEPHVEPKEEPQAETDIRRSTRDKKLKRPYSPPSGSSRRAKVCRSETQVVTSGETKLSPSVKDTEESQLPCTKTESVSPDAEPTRSDKDMSDGEDSLPPQPPPPPSYVDRGDRVKRLKELMKEKEKALEEILLRRKRELEERLADPELCDL